MPLKRTPKRITKRKSTPPVLVVGIGASAGGMAALKRFFSRLPKVEKAAFVILLPFENAELQLGAELKKYAASVGPVYEITDGLRIESNSIYLSPAGALISVDQDSFHVKMAKNVDQKRSLIDHLFTSIGKSFGTTSAGIILSGTGSDGAAGIRSVNEAGGLTLAQDPSSAEHSAMPESAVATGVVDLVLNPEQMASEVAEYVRFLDKLGGHRNQEAMKDQITSALTSICEILHKQTRHDFKHYKTSTLVRRIQRRMQVLQVGGIDEYIERLHQKKEEVDTLFKELLINVTSFFRDKDAFEALRADVLTLLVKNRQVDRKIRVWVAGCSTGEEAYSIAILFKELTAEMVKPPEVQIIATDIDEVALHSARRGAYSPAIAEHVSSERLEKYFVKRGGLYHVSKELRELCLFSIHNIITDPPFSQLDLISCRNLLIYLGSHLQKKLFPVFHYALRPSGFLFLGTSESLTTHRELFKSVNTKHRIAQRKATAIKLPSITTSVQNYLSHFQDTGKSASDADLGLVSQRIALDEMPFRYAVVNDEGQIVSTSAGISKYIEVGEGQFQNNLVKLAKPSLRSALRSSFSKAKLEMRRATNENCTIREGDNVERVGIVVQPMPQLGEVTGLFWVAFQYLGIVTNKTGGEIAGPAHHASHGDGEMVEQLERELAVLRTELDETVQNLEASNEELKSSNEELLSMNEELQSANEELESSKEEVQSTNDALQRANLDLENLLAGTQIATLFLGENMDIKGFTPAVTKIFRLQSTDVGRNIGDFRSLADDMPPLPRAALLLNDSIDETEVVMPDGTVYLRRTIPYLNNEKVREGVVVTFVDITTLRQAEAHYRQLADSMPHIVWTARPDGYIDYFNERWYQFTGYDRGTGGDQSWKPILHPDDVETTARLWYKAVESGGVYEVESRFWDRKTSSYRWFMGRAVPVRDANGAITKWFGSRVDIHDRVVAEESRRESEKRFQIMADSAPVLVWIANTDKQWTWFNKVWLEWTGRTMEQELGEGWVEGLHPEDRERYLKTYNEKFDARKKFYVEYRLKHHTGEYRWVSDQGVPRFTPDGTFEGYIGGCMDVNERILLQTDLVKARDEAERANASKSVFLANMSHEIRTPLAAITGFSDLLVGHFANDAEANGYVERISRNAGQLGKLIDELLDLSKIEADRIEIERAPVNVDSVLEDLFSTVNLRAQEKGLELKFVWLTEKPQDIVTDRVRLSQILTNIIGNAVKFTDHGNVRVEFSVTPHRFTARVIDTGIGLSEPQQERIFEPFMQADASVTRKYGGTGLGLALSKKLSILLGGDLRLLKTALGEGSTFEISIAIDQPVDPSLELGPTNTELPGPNALAGRKILVVDDSPDNRTIVNLFLRGVGAEIVEAGNGVEALQLVKTQTFDLVLMDIQMPVMDGYQAIEALRASDYKTPVIALTAHAFKEERDRCLRAGFSSYITKPVNRPGLLKTVYEVMLASAHKKPRAEQ